MQNFIREILDDQKNAWPQAFGLWIRSLSWIPIVVALIIAKSIGNHEWVYAWVVLGLLGTAGVRYLAWKVDSNERPHFAIWDWIVRRGDRNDG